MPGQNGTGRVIVGISGTLANLSALHAARRYAQQANAELVAINAWLPPGGEMAYRGECPIDILKFSQRNAYHTLADAIKRAFGTFPESPRLSCITTRGAPGPVLIAAASQLNDVLVIGTGRRTPFKFTKSGAVSRYCLRHARCNVLIVPPPDMIRDVKRIPRRHDANRIFIF